MAGEDGFSSLPIEIKTFILSLVEVKEAVRSSALARSWRQVWTHLPCLRLNYRRDRQGCSDFTDVSWLERVRHLVSSIQGPLLVFELDLSWAMFLGLDLDSGLMLQSTIDLLLQKGGVETLDLSFPTSRWLLHLPSFDNMQVLILSHCDIILPDGFLGFNRLRTLRMLDIGIRNYDMNFFLQTSRNLTSLAILRCHPLGEPLTFSINISLPLLKNLEFETISEIETLSIVSAPHLEHAMIAFRYLSCSLNVARMLRGLVTNVDRVSSLELQFDVVRSLSLVSLPSNFTFAQLRYFKFYLTIDEVDKRVYESFGWLLHSMPFLQELEIALFGGANSRFKETAILMEELLVRRHVGWDCLDRTLTKVTVGMSKLDVMSSIALIKFFLLNASMLQLMKIVHLMDCDVIQRMIRELQEVGITSLGAKVIIFNRDSQETIFLYDD
ncbi:F-box/RNI-like superfamily protein [Rhynchospora pubera]|uniref:F-box/RNI-like superfamily protein n=1 Tax=Rhynchospora pubera TaxID=906938 RepID=A0AAV8CL84_9POAL|nr:F-box/RNI-like superfamily protein [Rhynchospora pubera]KAJ4755521.1 F-box/RNI-like superfamily protein [Rhynchospora pubera]